VYFGYKELIKEIVLQTCLDVTDRPAIKELVAGLDLEGDESYQDIVTKWKTQVRLEATFLYLQAKYTRLFAEAQAEYTNEQAEMKLVCPDRDMDGSRLTVEAKRVLISTDPSMKKLSDRISKLKVLVDDLDRLSYVVFGRNKKLENLNIDYRRQLKADEGV
jgi:hypothetical protein